MATRKKAAPTKRAAATTAPPARADAQPALAPTRSPHAALRAAAQIIEAQKMLLHAGLRVLRVEREPAALPDEAPPASMEEVFDRRVASALQRLGLPDAAELVRLTERLEALERQFAAPQAKARR